MKRIIYYFSVLIILVSLLPATITEQAEEEVPDIITIKPTNSEDDE